MLILHYRVHFSIKLYHILQLSTKIDFSKTNFISPWNCFKLKNWTSKSNKNRPHTENLKCIILKKYQNCILELINLSVSLYFIIFPPNQWSMMIFYTEINILAFLLNFIEIVKSLKNRFFWLSSPKKSSKIIFFDFPENYDTSASIWYIYFGLIPNSLENVLKINQGVHFFFYSWYYLFSGTLICN